MYKRYIEWHERRQREKQDVIIFMWTQFVRQNKRGHSKYQRGKKLKIFTTIIIIDDIIVINNNVNTTVERPDLEAKHDDDVRIIRSYKCYNLHINMLLSDEREKQLNIWAWKYLN